MTYKRFKVTCKDCGATETIKIAQDNGVLWGTPVKIISARKRLDDQWGFQCLCGNDDLLTKQERKEIKNLQTPDPSDIRKVINNTKPSKPTFAMEAY